jgi:16S rRNA (guanine1207-N2)-methyltransferase
VSHYFDPQPTSASDPIRVEVNVPDVPFTYRTDTGVFSHGRLDNGTGLLLRCGMSPQQTGRLCDLGCGAGPIALWLGLRSPQAEVWAIDINERARQLTATNAEDLGLTITVSDPESIPDDLRFDEIWSNPPIRIGKPAMEALLHDWLKRLTPGGRMILVVSKHLGADSLHRRLESRGYRVERSASRGGFRILAISANP